MANYLTYSQLPTHVAEEALHSNIVKSQTTIKQKQHKKQSKSSNKSKRMKKYTKRSDMNLNIKNFCSENK